MEHEGATTQRGQDSERHHHLPNDQYLEDCLPAVHAIHRRPEATTIQDQIGNGTEQPARGDGHYDDVRQKGGGLLTHNQEPQEERRQSSVGQLSEAGGCHGG